MSNFSFKGNTLYRYRPIVHLGERLRLFIPSHSLREGDNITGHQPYWSAPCWRIL